MNNNHLYRQEYIRLLWVHSQQISNQTAKANEERKTLKLRQKEKIKSLNSGLDLLKLAYLTIKYFSELRKFNRLAEQNHSKLLHRQQEEIRKLKSSWELHTIPVRR
ncbi:hypothetical protein [Dyadobacter pollutisoli]|uniref:Uncharacterized protein n=1 Tax=Dyadobacter pollutisoli TaxID=2910158 RepID=A0A9E8NCM8_9BACT|nr:hypothetical protein [Dyadobacter pollutisoli]WAC13553.1 hypothetical protein ON006_06265 [Dyadobacter pollutisoli]